MKPIPSDTKAYESLEFFTYIRFKENANLDEAIKKCKQRNIEVLTERFDSYDFDKDAILEPVADIHLHTLADFDLKENGNNTLIIFLIILSLTILIIALTNYINLFMAQKEYFARHVGIQKILGSNKIQAICHFFGESSLVVIISFIAALLVLMTVKQWVATYVGINFMDHLWQSPTVYLMLGVLLLFSILIAGLYPAIHIGQIKNLQINRNRNAKSLRGFGRQQLVIFQFALVSCLIIGILSIHKQIKYIENKPKGFSSENVINYKRITYTLMGKWSSLVSELRRIPHVVAVTGSQAYPGSSGTGQGISYEGSPKFSIEEARVQQDYLKVFGIELTEGRFFDKPGLDENAIVLNQTAVKELGIENPVGKSVRFEDENVEIIGVVNDYNYESLKQRIAPLMLTNYSDQIYTLSLKTDGSSPQGIIDKVNTILHQFDPNYRVVYHFFNEELSQMYASEHALRRVFYLGTALGIIVALIGLLAFAALVTQQRTKEVGIRKVNGAKVSEIMSMLNKDFVKWVIIAFVIAAPVAWYAMHRWLGSFAYKTELSWWIFALAGVLALGIALLTVSWQSWKAATRNPVEALRYE
ncbi:MAG: ABC transporter permease [Mangrovibacterium sp.]